VVIAIRRMSGHVQCEGDRWWLNGRPSKSYSQPAKAGAAAMVFSNHEHGLVRERVAGSA
jgi:hypothetical protein